MRVRASGDALAYPESLGCCQLCPRRCGADRLAGQAGACGAVADVLVARAVLHFWEEPPLSGESGSGAVFFSHCPLSCRYCQNGAISQGGWGVATSLEGLAGAMLDLQAQGALNINLVTATHYAPQAREAVRLAREGGLTLPVVYNTSGYELPEAVRSLSGTVDIWLPDFKYSDASLALALSGVGDYPDVALKAIDEMAGLVDKSGGRAERQDGTMLRGIIVRHLVLPGHIDNSISVLDKLWECFGNSIDISVMNQYTPPRHAGRLEDFPELLGPLAPEDYELVLDHADDLGFERMWWQQGGTVSESFVPEFDGTGVAALGRDGL